MKTATTIRDPLENLSATDRLRYQQLLLAQANKPSSTTWPRAPALAGSSLSSGCVRARGSGKRAD